MHRRHRGRGGDWETDERIARAAIEAIGASWRTDKR